VTLADNTQKVKDVIGVRVSALSIIYHVALGVIIGDPFVRYVQETEHARDDDASTIATSHTMNKRRLIAHRGKSLQDCQNRSSSLKEVLVVSPSRSRRAAIYRLE
jgi:hypothetical protein